MLAAVTGPTGLVGANLVRMLLERGVQVRALTYGDLRALDGLDIECVECDVLDREAVQRGVSGADIVYHVAAAITMADRSDPPAERVNETGARNVAMACLDSGVRRLVHFSSMTALAPGPNGLPLDEDRPLCSGDEEFPYERSKARGQLAVLNAVGLGLDAVIVHPSAILGPYDFLPSPLGRGLMMWRRSRFPIVLRGGCDFVDVRDVCDGAIAAAEHGRAGENYILSGRYLTIKELVCRLSVVTGSRTPKIEIPLWAARMARPFVGRGVNGAGSKLTRFTLHTLNSRRHVTRDKAAHELGYKPRAIDDTLRDTFEWFDESGFA